MPAPGLRDPYLLDSIVNVTVLWAEKKLGEEIRRLVREALKRRLEKNEAYNLSLYLHAEVCATLDCLVKVICEHSGEDYETIHRLVKLILEEAGYEETKSKS